MTAVTKAVVTEDIETLKEVLRTSPETANSDDLMMCMDQRFPNPRFSDEALELLLRAGVNPDLDTASGWTPLAAAIESGRVPWVRLLLEHGANPNKLAVQLSSREPVLPVMLAAAQGGSAILKMLIEHGASYERSLNGFTAADYAELSGNSSLFCLLGKPNPSLSSREYVQANELWESVAAWFGELSSDEVSLERFYITSTDHPGWDVEVRFTEGSKPLKQILTKSVYLSASNWFICKAEKDHFRGVCSTEQLYLVVGYLLDWLNGSNPWLRLAVADSEFDITNWFLRQCDSQWEHCYSISILANVAKGWTFRVDLDETDIENLTFEGMYDFINPQDWLRCQVGEFASHSGGESSLCFLGEGDLSKLARIIEIFQEWGQISLQNR